MMFEYATSRKSIYRVTRSLLQLYDLTFHFTIMDTSPVHWFNHTKISNVQGVFVSNHAAVFSTLIETICVNVKHCHNAQNLRK